MCTILSLALSLSLSLAQKAYYKYFPITNISKILMHFS